MEVEVGLTPLNFMSRRLVKLQKASMRLMWALPLKCVKSIEHHFEVVSRDAPHQFHRIVCCLDNKQQKGLEKQSKAAAGPAPSSSLLPLNGPQHIRIADIVKSETGRQHRNRCEEQKIGRLEGRQIFFVGEDC